MKGNTSLFFHTDICKKWKELIYFYAKNKKQKTKNKKQNKKTKM